MRHRDVFRWAGATMVLVGLGVVLFGAYVGGGTYLRCTAARPGRADCRVEVRRCLGLVPVEVRDVRGVTAAHAETRLVKETFRSGKTSSTTTRTVQAWSLSLTLHDTGSESIAGLEPDVTAGADSLRLLLAGEGPPEVDLPFTEWKFSLAAMAFGAFWSLLAGFLIILTWGQ